MLDLSLDLTQKTEKKLRKLFEQYTDKELFAQSIIEHENFELKKGIINIQIDLKNFEEKYNMSTEIFYQKFESGELGDDENYMIWAGIYEMLLQNKKRLEELA